MLSHSWRRHAQLPLYWLTQQSPHHIFSRHSFVFTQLFWLKGKNRSWVSANSPWTGQSLDRCWKIHVGPRSRGISHSWNHPSINNSAKQHVLDRMLCSQLTNPLHRLQWLSSHDSHYHGGSVLIPTYTVSPETLRMVGCPTFTASAFVASSTPDWKLLESICMAIEYDFLSFSK